MTLHPIKDMEQKLCCVLSGQVVCRECDLRMCHACVRETYTYTGDGKESGPLYHERYNQCANGANLFTIDEDNTYIFWRKGSGKGPFDEFHVIRP